MRLTRTDEDRRRLRDNTRAAAPRTTRCLAGGALDRTGPGRRNGRFEPPGRFGTRRGAVDVPERFGH